MLTASHSLPSLDFCVVTPHFMKLLIFMANVSVCDPLASFMLHSSLAEGLMLTASSNTGTFAKPGGGVIVAVRDWTPFLSMQRMCSANGVSPEDEDDEPRDDESR